MGCEDTLVRRPGERKGRADHRAEDDTRQPDLPQHGLLRRCQPAVDGDARQHVEQVAEHRRRRQSGRSGRHADQQRNDQHGRTDEQRPP